MQLRLLGLLLLQPDRAWTQGELTATLAAPVASVHRELARAAAAGLIHRDATQRPHRYQAIQDAPTYEPMRQLLELTVGVPERLRAEFTGVAGLRAATIHGSWARGDLRLDSDLDLLVVGDDCRKARKTRLDALAERSVAKLMSRLCRQRSFAPRWPKGTRSSAASSKALTST
jgi:predicted nucleotidyltransferase